MSPPARIQPPSGAADLAYESIKNGQASPIGGQVSFAARHGMIKKR